ncbi:MAG: DUF6428 family protein [Akkermansiaceae bacterium]
MNFSEFHQLLDSHPDHGITLSLPDGTQAPPHFHITEVGAIAKAFLDCGGKHHAENFCVLQVWVADDYEHRIQAGKLAAILNEARKLLDSTEIPVEFEHEAPVLTRLPIRSHAIDESMITFFLHLKEADCLAKELCLPKRDFSLPDLPSRIQKTESIQIFSLKNQK